MKARFIFRIRIALILFSLVAAVLIGRLYYLQVIHGERYRALAEDRREGVTPSDEFRGDILFTSKDGREVSAAVMKEGYRLAINPSVIKDPQKVLEAIAGVVPVDEARFFKAAARTDDPYEEIAVHVGAEAGKALIALNMPGIVLKRERWRVYPGGDAAAHVLGFVGFKGDERIGRYGLERYWQEVLARPEEGGYANFFAELFADADAEDSSDAEGMTEGDLVTTIEPTVSRRLEETLTEVERLYAPKSAGGIVMDPRTGAIFAMAAHPTFNPNEFNQVQNPAVFVNPLVENVYELGSIMKPITVAMGLDAGVITPETMYEDTGCIERSGAKVCNYDGKARGRVSMQEVLNQSLNTGVTFIAEKLGRTRFAEYARAFALGDETGIDLPNEVTGLLDAIDSSSAVDLASASFGQGIALTPLAMTRALAALGNGGVLPEPHVVRTVRYASGVNKRVWHEGQRRAISPEAAEEVTRMLVEVVDTSLAKGTLTQEHYSIAAKTGTAQIAERGGGYYEDRFLHSFFGYFPAHDPKFIVFLYAVEPQGVEYASQSLARPFMDLAKFLINYYDIPPDR